MTDDLRSDDFGGDFGEVCRWVVTHCRADAGEALRAGMDTLEILRALGVDRQTLLVGLLQPLLPLDEKEQSRIVARFGALTLTLLHGAARMRQLSSLSHARTDSATPAAGIKTGARAGEENLRKMLITMVDDIRVVLIELARHLSVLRHCAQAGEEAQRSVGRITLEVYAPLANRLGVWEMKWRMEDYALRCLAPGDYRNLAALLDEKRIAREEYIGEFIAAVRAALKEAAVDGEVRGRPKHLYSIWKKMRSKGLAFENLRDLRAVRILVDSVADCYSALAVVHTRWQSLPGEFDDYIATPKANGYRSIHTVIVGPRGKTVEVQIRTREMHHQSELGVAAHWRYKENVRPDDNIDNKVLRLRQLLEWKEDLQEAGADPAGHYDDNAHDDNAHDDNAQADNAHDDNAHDDRRPAGKKHGAEERVYVFTPKGRVIDLPAGATPIDFAYAIHTEIGHGIRGAKIDGKMVPLGYRLKTGEQVYIQTVKGGHPSRDWLRAEPGYVRTRRARARIAHWFKRADYAHHLAEGRSMLERELSRRGMEDLGYEKIARETHFRKTDDMLAAVGANDFKLSRALAPFRAAERRAQDEPPKSHSRPRAKRFGNFNVSGVGNLLTYMAGCCNPIPGDPIVGFITVRKGVCIHRKNCHNMSGLDAQRRNRLIEVQWGESESASYPVDIRIFAHHRNGLLHDITQCLKDDKIEVLMLNTETDDEHGVNIELKLEISGLKNLKRILGRLSRIPNVIRAGRAAS